MDHFGTPILVTGGAGYIGSHACKALAKRGYFPITYDNLVYGHRWAVKWGPLEEGDVSDRQRLDDVFSRDLSGSRDGLGSFLSVMVITSLWG